ncbi:DUF2461 domain-containing protein [Bdellovibrio bacteriovorus]|uniref:DUF2461 domain-containing protein n=1 Tax=Bdellovibrio bacteriovorus TaxID=959 RepID=UPI0035A6E3DA
MKKATVIEIPDFKGFSPEAFRFLRSLKKNNRREWFQPRKEDYQRLVHLPMMGLIMELGEVCRSFAPEVPFNPQRNILRVYRDTRFSKDKTPYKTFVGASFPYGNFPKTVDSTGLYMQIEPGEVFIGGGLWKPSSLQLRKIRQFMLQDPDAFLEIIEDKNFKKHFGSIQGEKLKTTPRGISPDHPLVEYLRLKQFFISISLPEDAALKKDLPKKIAAEFKLMMPLLRWLNKSQRMW